MAAAEREADAETRALPVVPLLAASLFGVLFVGGLVGGVFLLSQPSGDDEVAAEGRGVGDEGSRERARRARDGTDEASEAQAGATPTAADPALASARSEVSIEIFSASWCGACRAARAYMDEHGIDYTVRDVDEDPSASEQLRQISPRGSIPAITFDGGNPMVGFSPRELEARIDRAAQARVEAL